MDTSHEQTHIEEKNPKIHEACEEMLKLSSNQRNANESHSKKSM